MVAQTFVVPLDGSGFAERAIPVASAIAERVNGRLLVVSAPYHGVLHPDEYLAGIVARYPNVPVETRAHPDFLPADAILNVVRESDDRVVVMSSHGRGRVRWSMLGSTAEEVVRQSDRPLFLVGRHCRDDFLTPGARLLACVDGTETSERIAPIATEWAARLGLAVNAAIVIHPQDVANIEHPEVLLDPIVEHFGGLDRAHATLLRNAYVAGALADFAGELPASLIAMSSYARTGIARVSLGSVTMAVLQLAECPLLVTHSPS